MLKAEEVASVVVPDKATTSQFHDQDKAMVCHAHNIGFELPVNIIFFLYNITCAIISVFGNGVVVYVICKVRRLQNRSNWLLVGLASADLLAGAIAQPLDGIYKAFFHSSSRCDVETIIMFMSAASCCTSLPLLCFIARDRYLHLSEGTTYNQFSSERKISFQIFGSWVIGLITAGTFMLKGLALRWYLGFTVWSVLISSSFIYASVMYFRIQKILQTHFKRMREGSSHLSSMSAARLAKQKSYNTTMLIILSLFFIAFFPFMVSAIITVIYRIKGEIPIWLRQGFEWTTSLMYTNGAINPFIYAIRYRDVGREMKNLIRKIVCIAPLSRQGTEQSQDNISINKAYFIAQ